MLNTVTLMGRLTANPELKKTPSDISVTTFAVAVDRDYVTKGEQRQADFIDVVAWRSTADFVAEYFTKGSMIAIVGALQTRSYEDKNGNKRKAVEVVASKVSFCGDKNQKTKANNENTGSEIDANGFADFEPMPDDDLPF